jgi:hypothetical protein
MNPQEQHNPGVRAVPVPYSRRTDVETAKIVNQGILFQARIGTDYAAAYLSCKGISVEIAMRVLARPWQRRK